MWDDATVSVRQSVRPSVDPFVSSPAPPSPSERNENYHEIMKRIQFPSDICRGKTIMNHDYIFWCGDFNYRIDMANDQVKLLIAKENWHLLAEGDQLHLQVGWRSPELNAS